MGTLETYWTCLHHMEIGEVWSSNSRLSFLISVPVWKKLAKIGIADQLCQNLLNWHQFIKFLTSIDTSVMMVINLIFILRLLKGHCYGICCTFDTLQFVVWMLIGWCSSAVKCWYMLWVWVSNVLLKCSNSDNSRVIDTLQMLFCLLVLLVIALLTQMCQSVPVRRSMCLCVCVCVCVSADAKLRSTCVWSTRDI